TKSQNFPFCSGGEDSNWNGATDGFILKIDPVNFNVTSGTFVGTGEYDQVYFLQTDLNDNIYCLGQTTGSMSITPGLYGQPNSGQFIRKYNPTLSTLNCFFSKRLQPDLFQRLGWTYQFINVSRIDMPCVQQHNK
ncbi:MAG: hypothetical protein NWP82_03165, partial [Flavobacteriales bacterium]|nr:hypothetical protein [Flavobacteriales bacterium]